MLMKELLMKENEVLPMIFIWVSEGAVKIYGKMGDSQEGWSTQSISWTGVWYGAVDFFIWESHYLDWQFIPGFWGYKLSRRG